MNTFLRYSSLLKVQIQQQAYFLKIVVLCMMLFSLGLGVYLQDIRLPAQPLKNILENPSELLDWIDYHEERADKLLPLNGLQFTYDADVPKNDQLRLNRFITQQRGVVANHPERADFILTLNSNHQWQVRWNTQKPRPLWILLQEDQPLERRLAYLFYLEHQAKLKESLPADTSPTPTVNWVNHDEALQILQRYDDQERPKTDDSRQLTLVLISFAVPGLMLFGFGPTLVGIEWDQRRSAGELEVWALSTQPMWWLFSTQMLSYAFWSGLPLTTLLVYYVGAGHLQWVTALLAWIALHSLALLMGHLNLLSTVLFRHRYGRTLSRAFFNPIISFISAALQYTLFSNWAEKAKSGNLVEADLQTPFTLLTLIALAFIGLLSWGIEKRIGRLREGLRQV